MKKLFSTIFLTLLFSSNVQAVSLEEALSNSYNHHEDFKSKRVEFIDSLEKFPRALSSFIPNINAGAEYSKSKTKRHNPNTGNPEIPRSIERANYSKSVTLDQSIFEGFGGVAGLRSAQAAFRASRAEYYANEQSIMQKVIETYINLVETKERYNIATISVNANKTQLDAVQEKFYVGEATETDLASMRQAMASAEARQAGALSSFESAKSEFMRVFNMEPTDVKMPEVPQDLPKSLEELHAKALSINPSLEAARHRVSSLKADEYKAKAEILPKVRLRLQGSHDYPNNPAGQNNSNTYNVASVVSVSVPILSKGGAEYSDIRHAKNQKRRAAIELDSITRQLDSNSKSSWLGFSASKTRANAASEAVKAAEVAYEGMIQEESLGSKTILDVLQAQERLNKVREEEIAAKKDLVLAAYQMKSLTGHLTAKGMKLKVKYFEPEQEFKKIKTKVIGF
jgi:outer membrane protein